MFSDLKIWRDSSISDKLLWYRGVADNNLPAKYLICRRIPIIENYLDKNTSELWSLHEKATQEFIDLKNSIFSHQVDLGNTPIVSPNLMDLNLELVNRMLKSCTFCKWNCEVDRSIIDGDPEAKRGTCQLGETSRIGSYFHHRGEELIYRGTQGSGTIFFTSCNMRCQFCQNGNISQDKDNGTITNDRELAAIIWLLRMEGCHNTNLVGGDPVIHLHTIVRAIHRLDIKRPSIDILKQIFRFKSDYFVEYPIVESYGSYNEEFNTPILWNSNLFLSEQTLKILRTIIDIWLPDFKFGPDKKCATTLSRTPWYFQTISANHKSIYDWGEDFTIRHLIMPEHVECCSIPILDWIKSEIPDAMINIMDQYHPDSFTDPHSPVYNDRFASVNRRLRKDEISKVIQYANKLVLNYEMATNY